MQYIRNNPKRKILHGTKNGGDGVMNSVNVICNLRELQTAVFTNLPNPRGKFVKLKLREVSKEKKQSKSRVRFDRSKGLSLEVYEEDVHIKIALGFGGKRIEEDPSKDGSSTIL